jgi:hypothetical protein
MAASMIVQTGRLDGKAKIELTQSIKATFYRFPASVDCWKLAKVPEGNPESI